MKRTNWQDVFKIRIANPNKFFEKHEIIKLLLVMKILQKYRIRNHIRIYTELELDNGQKPDVYFEDLKNKSIVIYEIQKSIDKDYIKEKQKQTDDLLKTEFFFKTVDLVVIPLNEFTDDIKEISLKLEKYVV